MTCQQLVELVTDYLEGSLDPTARQRFEEHLSDCTGCQNYVAQMRTTIKLVGKLTESDLTPSMQDELLTVFRNWKRDSQR
ncbi:MAG: zf-HC2 domain-containing protein [Anaerolineae bacterium]|nr:zf-HC2 domain-containing protein [Anaerolineae bacterium]